jgi:hypothetical protein
MMPRTTIRCPNCRQPITADVEQLFDVGKDPANRQRFLSGAINLVQCPHCGYQGNLATPIVYHDPDKELLLTFVPPEIGLPRDEQERLIGGLINQVVTALPQERRKAYLFRPQSFLTQQSLVERVLEAEGITKEMIEAQQKRLNLLQRLLGASEDVMAEIVKQEDAIMDADFFSLLRRLVDAAMMGGDQEAAQQLAQLQQRLVPITSYGRELQEQTQEIEAAVNELRSAGRELNQDKMLDLVLKATNETRMRAYVSLARPLLDYTFFQKLSERIDRARGDGRTRLVEIREKLLEWTRQVDQQIEQRAQASRQMLDEILNTENISETMGQALPAVDEFFVQELNRQYDEARKAGDLDKLSKLQKVVDVLQQASAAPPEVQLIEELLEAPDDQTRRQMMEEHRDEITPEFLQVLAGFISQVESGEDQEVIERLRSLNRQALRFSMEKNL